MCPRTPPHFDSPSGALVRNQSCSRARPLGCPKRVRERAPAMRRGAGPPGGRLVVRRGQPRVPSARRPISQTQQASSRAAAAEPGGAVVGARPDRRGDVRAGRRGLRAGRARQVVPRRLHQRRPGEPVARLGYPAVFVSSSGFQLRQRFFSHVARKSFRFGKGVPLPLSGFAS